MRQILIDAMKLGIGTLDLTHEQVEKFVAKVEKKYGKEIKDSRKMVDDLFAQAEKNQSKVHRKIQKEVKDAMRKQKLVKEEDLKAFQKQAKALAKTSLHMAKTASGAIADEVSKRVAEKKRTTRRKSAKRATRKRAAKKSTRKRTAKKTARRTAKKSTRKRPARKSTRRRPAKRASRRRNGRRR